MKAVMAVAAIGLGLAASERSFADTFYECEATVFTQRDGATQGRLWMSDRGRGDVVQFRYEDGLLEFTQTSPVQWDGDQVRMTLLDAPAVGHGESSGGFIRFSGVLGAARDAVWWADCLTTPSEARWAQDGETVTGDEQELRALEGLDMDTGRILDVEESSAVDIFLGMFMGRNPVIVAGPRARIMLSSERAGAREIDPTNTACSGVREERVGQGLPFASIERDSVICVLTDNNYLGALRVTDADGGADPYLRFSFERWGRVR